MTALAHAYWILRHEQYDLLLIRKPFSLLPPSTADAASARRWRLAGRAACYAAELKIFPEHPDLQPLPLRALLPSQAGGLASPDAPCSCSTGSPAPFCGAAARRRGSVR
jgi:hypothetical protein